MAYRNGVYVAFNGCGTKDPTESDFRYYGLLQAWKKDKNKDFSFVDSHDKTYKVQDSSSISTLKSRLSERLRNSKSMLLILSERTNTEGSILPWEIEVCVEKEIPIIIAYTMCKEYLDHYDVCEYMKYFPENLKDFIKEQKAVTVHIPFNREFVTLAIDCFSVHTIFEYKKQGHVIIPSIYDMESFLKKLPNGYMS